MTGTAGGRTASPLRRAPSVPVVAVAALCVLLALTGCGSSGPDPTTSTSAPSTSVPSTPASAPPTSTYPVTLWTARRAACPTPTATRAAAGSVLSHDGRCFRLIERTGTFHSPVDATAHQRDGRWWVDVVLDPTQTRVMARASREAVGRMLAMVTDGTIITAAQVQEPIPGGRIQIAATSSDRAKRTAALLSGP